MCIYLRNDIVSSCDGVSILAVTVGLGIDIAVDASDLLSLKTEIYVNSQELDVMVITKVYEGFVASTYSL